MKKFTKADVKFTEADVKFTEADVKFTDGTERKNAQIYMGTWFGYPAFYAKHRNKDVEVTLKNGEYIQKWEDKDVD